VKVTVRVTAVAEQMDGVPWLLFVSTPLQPPEAVAEASQALYAASSWAWVKQALAVVGVGQVSTTVGGAATVNVAWQVVVVGAQLLV
jgi:hypothetical protein